VAHPGADRRVSLRAIPAQALGDPLLTGRVLDNLLDNALRHGGQGVEVGVEAGPGVARITVTDDGPGIAREARARIFERFSRDGEAGTGFGLGLAIARGLAEAQGGRLWLDEASPRTCFVLELASATDAGATT
jgi:signal transduction histidine kinase